MHIFADVGRKYIIILIIINFTLQANRHVGDLFIDLQDGLNLISLLEVLSGDQLVNYK